MSGIILITVAIITFFTIMIVRMILQGIISIFRFSMIVFVILLLLGMIYDIQFVEDMARWGVKVIMIVTEAIINLLQDPQPVVA